MAGADAGAEAAENEADGTGKVAGAEDVFGDDAEGKEDEEDGVGP